MTLIEISTICVQGQPNQYALIAVRTNAVQLPLGLGPAGHVGVGFQNDDLTWTIGAVENTGGSPMVAPFFDNGGWVENGKTLPEVAVKLHSLGYDMIKLIIVNYPNSNKAQNTIKRFPTRGYNVVDNNCLSATIDVLYAYGVEDLPSRTIHVAPTDYYANVRGNTKEYLWDLNGKKYTNIETGISLLDERSISGPNGNIQSPAPITQGSESSVVGRWLVSSTVEQLKTVQFVIRFNSDGTVSYDNGDTYNWKQYGDTVQWYRNPQCDDYGTRIDCYPTYEGTIKTNSMEGTLLIKQSPRIHSPVSDKTGYWKAVRIEE